MKLRIKSIEIEKVEDDIAVITGSVQAFRSLANNQVRMMIEVDPEYRDIALHWFDEIGISVALARLNPEISLIDEKSVTKEGTS